MFHLSSISKYITEELTDRSYTVIKFPVGIDGIINIIRFKELLEKFNGRVLLVSCMYANNETGIIQPIDEVLSLEKDEEIQKIEKKDKVKKVRKIKKGNLNK